MKIFITGGGGFVGRNLTKQLLQQNHEITITSTGSDFVNPAVSKVAYCGLTGIDFNLLRNQEVLIHLMANNDTLCKDKEEMFRTNVYGPIELFRKAASFGCKKIIYASSTAVYGSENPPYKEEETPINPLNAYGESKALFDDFAMKFAKENNITIIGLRYCNIYGPGEEQKNKRMSFIGQILHKTLQKKQINLFKFGEQKRDWIYIEDVIEANLLALQNSIASNIFNVGSGCSHAFNEIICNINNLFDLNIVPKYIDCDFKNQYQSYTECDISKIKRELGFVPKFSLKSGIKKYYEYLKEII